jgi:hypothetical protein
MPKVALVAWYSVHRIRLKTRILWVRIPPGCKVFKNVYITELFRVKNFLKKLSKQSPTVQNSPNLVTLLQTLEHCQNILF